MKDPSATTLLQIEKYIVRKGMKETRFGRLVCNNAMLVRRIKAGRVKVETLMKAQRYMEANR